MNIMNMMNNKNIISVKKLFICALFACMLMGCSDKQNPDGTYSAEDYNQRVYTIDSCEYIKLVYGGSKSYFIHKGNCKYCAKRQKQLYIEVLDSLLNTQKSKMN